MATDSHERDSHRKHRRSVSDDEAEKPSKRHKHRHHRHRHHHHHHRSRKLEEEKETGGDDTTPRVPAFPVATNGGQIDNDDVEEGEILDEENSEMKKLGSGEVDAVASRNGVETRYPGISEMDVMKEDAGKSTDENFVTDSITSNKMHDKNYVNGSLHREDREDDSWKRESESRSPSKRSGRSKTCMDRSEGKLSDRRKSLSSESSGDMHKRTVYSPSRDKIHSRSRSRSPDPARERSRSRSVIEDDAYLRRRHHSERHSSRDFVMEDGREDSTGYSSRYSVRGERHRSREIQHRETSRERGIEREERRRIERESSKYAGIYRDYRRDNEREKSKDRETYRGREERDRSRYGEGDGGRAWEKERGRSRDRGRMSDRDIDRKRERERDRDRVRDRESERRSDRVRDKGRDNERERKKYVNPDDVYDNRDRHKHSRILTNDDKDHYRDRKRKNESAKAHGSDSYSWEGGEDKRSRDEEDEQLEFEEKVALQLVDQEEEELKRIKEESRKRRQAILEKYKNQQLQQQNESRSADAGDDKKHIEHHGPSTGADNNHLDNRDAKGQDGDFDAADQLQSVKKLPSHDAIAAFDRAAGAGGLGEGSPKSETSDHIFCDDIFGETPTGVRKSGKAEGLKIVRSGLHDNWDDAEGYYSYRFGETLDGRYEVIATHGKGVFSTVVRAKDLKAGHGEPEEVAIKIIRNNETMNKAGQTEVQILKKLAGADPENKRHCVRFISSFKYRNHLCLVFESLNMNLREVLKKFGRNIGLKLTAVRAYAKQLFISLKHLRNCGVLHCDIKPDNMLVNEAKNVLKLCDFGNAMFAGKNEITPYLVSRFYRAPEIILGLPYDHPLDIWSVGCCLYELFTGKVLFPGATNNDMLRLHMELKGSFPKKMLRKGAFTDQHFDQDLNFHATEEDPVTKKTIKRIIVNIKPKDIGSIVKNSAGEDPKMLANFKDLLEKIFVLDPEKRMTVAQALTHPFISGK